ncbi:MAG TPA: DUF4156 domain-containing protein [Gammaproteobacteria bacterium]|nr:DUF4156 domain-containing protein [Gammaproteobacteria bacterium]
MRYLLMALVSGTLLVSGCTWVDVKPAAQEVLVLSKARVANCARLGTTEVSVAESVGFLNRVPEDVAKDLANLARNQAVEMGGDTITPLSEPHKGQQTFGVYNCVQDDGQSPQQPQDQDNNGVETIPYRG